MLRTTMMLLTILCLSGCRSVNTRIVCAQLQTEEIKPIKSCDLSFQFNRCRCRCFDFNSWEKLDWGSCSGGLEGKDPIDFPVEECDGISGFYLEDVATEVRPKIKRLHRLKENLCQ